MAQQVAGASYPTPGLAEQGQQQPAPHSCPFLGADLTEVSSLLNVGPTQALMDLSGAG